MHYKKIYKKIFQIEKEYKILKSDLDKEPLLNSKINHYLKDDKEQFKIFWKRYIKFFDKLKKLLKASKYRNFFFFINYNKLVLNKYLVHFYFNAILDLLKSFWKHEVFIRVFLDENFLKDYWVYAKYIYLPKYINVINTPRIFIKPFKDFIDKEIYKLLDDIIDLNINRTINADYNNLFFWIKYRVDKLIFIISKYIWNFISRTRFTTRKHPLVTKTNLSKYVEIAEPWDILLTRWNWNASNISIPWFWKHMAMYIWTWRYLKKHFKWYYIDELQDESNYIIEATWKWIDIVEIHEFASHIDYLWVARTTFSKEKIKRTINNALLNLWKGYDFIFNFYSDKKLVCTALILKSYAKENRKDEWIDIELEKIGISLTYPPNNFINKLIEENQKKSPLIEWVFFIDSIEKTWENFVSSVPELLKSWDRPKLSIFLK